MQVALRERDGDPGFGEAFVDRAIQVVNDASAIGGLLDSAEQIEIVEWYSMIDPSFGEAYA